MGEEVVDALCIRIPAFNKGKWKRSDNAGEGSSDPPRKKNNKFRQGNDDPLVAAMHQKGGKPPAKATSNHFEKKWNEPCTNPKFLVKHLLKECTLL